MLLFHMAMDSTQIAHSLFGSAGARMFRGLPVFGSHKTSLLHRFPVSGSPQSSLIHGLRVSVGHGNHFFHGFQVFVSLPESFFRSLPVFAAAEFAVFRAVIGTYCRAEPSGKRSPQATHRGRALWHSQPACVFNRNSTLPPQMVFAMVS